MKAKKWLTRAQRQVIMMYKMGEGRLSNCDTPFWELPQTSGGADLKQMLTYTRLCGFCSSIALRTQHVKHTINLAKERRTWKKFALLGKEM
jgi:hypothetical protein